MRESFSVCESCGFGVPSGLSAWAWVSWSAAQTRPLDAVEQSGHERRFDVQVAIGPAIPRGCTTGVQLARCDQVARARRGIVNLMPAIECAAPSIVEADRIEVVHMRRERMVHPPGAHHFESVQPGAAGVLSEVSCLPIACRMHDALSSIRAGQARSLGRYCLRGLVTGMK